MVGGCLLVGYRMTLVAKHKMDNHGSISERRWGYETGRSWARPGHATVSTRHTARRYVTMTRPSAPLGGVLAWELPLNAA